MANWMGLAGLAVVTGVSLLLALGIKCLCLRGVFLLLSASARRSTGTAANSVLALALDAGQQNQDK